MCARLGIISQMGLGRSITEIFSNKAAKAIISILIFSAIIIGNSAYEAGNISGASLGLTALFAGADPLFITLLIGLVAAVLILSGSYKLIEKVMIFLVVTMSLVFILTAVYIKPDLMSIFKGSFIPAFPQGSTFVIIGLIGTTVVPYNLFLHTSSAATKWNRKEDIPIARFDTVISIIIGGLISIAIVIVITSAASMGTGKITSAADLAVQLQPLLGEWAAAFVSTGLFAAGMTSTVTASLAAGFAASGIFGFPSDLRDIKFKIVCMTILLIGVIFSISGFKPVEVIQFAQIANGILLPFVAVFLVWIMNRKKVLGNFANNVLQNILAFLVIIITIMLGLKSIFSATGFL